MATIALMVRVCEPIVTLWGRKTSFISIGASEIINYKNIIYLYIYHIYNYIYIYIDLYKNNKDVTTVIITTIIAFHFSLQFFI